MKYHGNEKDGANGKKPNKLTDSPINMRYTAVPLSVSAQLSAKTISGMVAAEIAKVEQPESEFDIDCAEDSELLDLPPHPTEQHVPYAQKVWAQLFPGVMTRNLLHKIITFRLKTSNGEVSDRRNLGP